MQSELDVSLPKQIISILYESCRNQRRDNKYVGICRNPNSWHSIPFVIERSVISLGVSQHVHKIKKNVKFLIQLVIERIIEEKKTLVAQVVCFSDALNSIPQLRSGIQFYFLVQIF